MTDSVGIGIAFGAGVLSFLSPCVLPLVPGKYQPDRFLQDLLGLDPSVQIKVRVYTEFAWHSLFIRTMLRRPERAELDSFVPNLTIIDPLNYTKFMNLVRQAMFVITDECPFRIGR